MKFKFTHAASMAAFALLATAGTAQATQFIVNGDFSDPDANGGYVNTQVVPGWQNLAETYVEVGSSFNDYMLPAINAEGQNLEVNNTTFGDVVQTVTGLTIGDSYTLMFDYGGRPGSGTQELDVKFGGDLLVQDTGSIGVWTPNSFIVTATSTSETLEFLAIDTTALGGGSAIGNEITNVSLTGPVPEPASWAMMIAGFALIGVALRRRISPVRVSFG